MYKVFLQFTILQSEMVMSSNEWIPSLSTTRTLNVGMLTINRVLIWRRKRTSEIEKRGVLPGWSYFRAGVRGSGPVNDDNNNNDDAMTTTITTMTAVWLRYTSPSAWQSARPFNSCTNSNKYLENSLFCCLDTLHEQHKRSDTSGRKTRSHLLYALLQQVNSFISRDVWNKTRTTWRYLEQWSWDRFWCLCNDYLSVHITLWTSLSFSVGRVVMWHGVHLKATRVSHLCWDDTQVSQHLRCDFIQGVSSDRQVQ